MTPCCVRLTISTSRTCGWMSPGRKPRSMIPMPPSSACTIAIGARVTVSMLAETIGRSQGDVLRHAARQVDRGRVAPRKRRCAAASAGSRRTSRHGRAPRRRAPLPASMRGKLVGGHAAILPRSLAHGIIEAHACSTRPLWVSRFCSQQIPPVPPLPQPPFDEWLSGVRAEALTRGIRDATARQRAHRPRAGADRHRARSHAGGDRADARSVPRSSASRRRSCGRRSRCARRTRPC